MYEVTCVNILLLYKKLIVFYASSCIGYVSFSVVVILFPLFCLLFLWMMRICFAAGPFDIYTLCTFLQASAALRARPPLGRHRRLWLTPGCWASAGRYAPVLRNAATGGYGLRLAAGRRPVATRPSSARPPPAAKAYAWLHCKQVGNLFL